MAGIFPNGGVDAAQTTGGKTVAPENLANGCSALFFRNTCNPTFDPVWANNMISEMLNLALVCDPDFVWDCNRQDNLLRAMSQFCPPDCEDAVANADNQFRTTTFTFTGDHTNGNATALAQIQAANGWNIPEAFAGPQHQTLSKAGMLKAFSGSAGAYPTISSQIRSNTLSQTSLVTEVSSLISDLNITPRPADGNAQLVLGVGTLITDCDTPAGSTIRFRVQSFISAANQASVSESILAVWSDGVPKPNISSADQIAYAWNQDVNAPHMDVQEEISVPVPVNGKIGLFLGVYDASAGSNEFIQYSLNGGAWITIQTAADLATGGFTLDSGA